eukprot:g1611.t1
MSDSSEPELELELESESEDENAKLKTSIKREKRETGKERRVRIRREKEEELARAKQEILRQRARVKYEELTELKDDSPLDVLAYDKQVSVNKTLRDLTYREADMKRRIEKLCASIEETRGLKHTVNCHNVDVYDIEASAVAPEIMHHADWRCNLQRTMKEGHKGKVFALAWAKNDLYKHNKRNCSPNLATVANDGKLIIWNARTGLKRYAISLTCPWAMSCCYEPCLGALVGVGLMSGEFCVYRLAGGDDIGETDKGNWTGTLGRDRIDLRYHHSYVSSCKFLPDGIESRRAVTASGDGQVIVWDVRKEKMERVLRGHSSDVLGVDVSPIDNNIFVSGSCDSSCKVWDVRSSQCVMHFGQDIFGDRTHGSDVNCVEFMPSGYQFVSGSDDGSARLFDLRSYSQQNKFDHVRNDEPVTSLCLSKTGRLLIVGTDDGLVFAWDTLRRLTLRQEFGFPFAHKNRVSALDMNAEGQAVASGSFDGKIKIWA